MGRLASGQLPVLLVTLLCCLATTAAGSQITFGALGLESPSYAFFSSAAEDQHAAGLALMQTGGQLFTLQNFCAFCIGALCASAKPAAP
jgi:hypothetical protein